MRSASFIDVEVEGQIVLVHKSLSNIDRLEVTRKENEITGLNNWGQTRSQLGVKVAFPNLPVPVSPIIKAPIIYHNIKIKSELFTSNTVSERGTRAMAEFFELLEITLLLPRASYSQKSLQWFSLHDFIQSTQDHRYHLPSLPAFSMAFSRPFTLSKHTPDVGRTIEATKKVKVWTIMNRSERLLPAICMPHSY